MLCLGNICRSPTAQVVLTARLASAGLGGLVEVVSCGTGDWHLGGPMDRRAARTLISAGYDPSRHRARQFDRTWFADLDAILAMDRMNLRTAHAMAQDDDTRSRVLLYRWFDPAARHDADDEVPDPYDGGPQDYAHVLDIVERTTGALVMELRRLVGR